MDYRELERERESDRRWAITEQARRDLEKQNARLNDPKLLKKWSVDQYAREVGYARSLYAEAYPEENKRLEEERHSWDHSPWNDSY